MLDELIDCILSWIPGTSEWGWRRDEPRRREEDRRQNQAIEARILSRQAERQEYSQRASVTATQTATRPARRRCECGTCREKLPSNARANQRFYNRAHAKRYERRMKAEAAESEAPLQR